MTVSLAWTPCGVDAEHALAARLDELKGGDLLRQVTVVVRAPQVGLSARRALAASVSPDGRRGVVNVSFTTVHGLAEDIAGRRLVADGRLPLHDAALRAAAAAALAHGEMPGVSNHPSTIDAVVRTYKELRRHGTRSVGTLASGMPRARSLARLLRGVHQKLSAGWFDGTDLVAAACAEVATDGLSVTERTGPIVVWLPDLLAPPELELLRALGDAGTCLVLCGQTGHAPTDDAVAAQWSVGPTQVPASAVQKHGDVSVLSAPTSDTEVRLVVRELMDRAAAGIPLERMAIAHSGSAEYVQLLHTSLERAGIPFHGAGARSLASTVAGRLLLGALALPEGNWRREEVVRWLSTGPIRLDGRRVPATRWDLLSAEAGVVEGLAEWRTALGRLAEGRRVAAERGDPDRSDEETWRQMLGDDARAAAALVASLEWLDGRLSDGPSEWAAWSVWARRLLRSLAGGPSAWDGWPVRERAAADAVVDAIDRVGDLGRMGLPCNSASARAALESELSAPAPQTARFGTGVWVAPLSAVPGVSLDALFVVGVNDGVLPTPPSDDVILPDRDRVGTNLPRRAAQAAAVQRDYVAAVAGASSVQLSFARGSRRDGRELRPSRWVLDALADQRGTGERLYLRDLPALTPSDRYRVVPSFAASLVECDEPLDLAERDLSSLHQWVRSGRPVARHPLAGPGTRLRRSVAMLGGRGSFGRFEGRTGPAPVPTAWTASSLTQYAACPRRYFFESVLRVAPRVTSERGTATDRAQLGSLVHRILERYVRPQIGRLPGAAPDDPFDEQRLLEIADEEATALEAAGLVGPPSAWRAERVRMERMLRSFARADRAWRTERGVVTVGVEESFGPNQSRQVAVHTENGQVVQCRGRMDRVDALADGSLIVTDYKTGRVVPLDAADETLDGGRAVQLPLYGAAAGAATDHPTEVAYLSLGDRLGCARYEVPVEGRTLGALQHVIGTIADATAAGTFPAHPVAGPGRPSPCTYCPFTSVCPSQRSRVWERVQQDDALQAYTAIAA